MEEKLLSETIQKLAEDLVPGEINLWPKVQKQIDDQIVQKNVFSHKTKQLRLAIGFGVALVLVILIFTLTPVRETFAQVMQNFFKIKEIEQVATYPAEEFKTPTNAPTFAATISTIEPTSALVLLPDPTQDPTLSSCYEDLNGSACKIAQAEKRAGFDAKQFPSDPEGLRLAHVESNTNQIIMEYHYINHGNFLFLKQGIAEEFPDFGGVPEDAIEDVLIGYFPGEFAAGMYVNVGDPPIVQWLETDRYRLRWMEGNHWFEIDSITGMPPDPGTYGDRDRLIGMAMSLVFQAEQQDLRPEFITNIQDAALLAGFIPQEPQVLPQGFQFDHGEYDEELNTLSLIYTHGGENLLYGAVTLMQTTHETMALNPTLFQYDLEWEEVSINGFSGRYYSTDDFHHLANWTTNEATFLLEIWINKWDYGATMTKYQVLDIANSVR